MPSEDVNLRSWTEYGHHHLARGTEITEVDDIRWGFGDSGPGSQVLGDVRGSRVLDLCSGIGRHAAHLARDRGAVVDAVDCSPTQYRRARARYHAQERLRLVLSDAVGFLAAVDTPYDVIYSRHGLSYLDPRTVLPALARAVRRGGRLVFSVIHTTSDGRGPSPVIEARTERLPLGEGTLPVRMWIVGVAAWRDLLAEHGFRLEEVQVLDASEDGSPVSCRLFVARRTDRASSRPRTAKAPLPNAAVGVGAVVHGPHGLLLGRHRRGTWELPGGTVEPGESLHEAVMRELHEETGLVARPDDVDLLGCLLDEVDGVVRMTVAAHVTAWTGEPVTREPTIGGWAWWPPASLPDDLFVCTAQVLTAWRPDLPIDHPPAHYTPFARGDEPRE